MIGKSSISILRTFEIVTTLANRFMPTQQTLVDSVGSIETLQFIKY